MDIRYFRTLYYVGKYNPVCNSSNWNFANTTTCILILNSISIFMSLCLQQLFIGQNAEDQPNWLFSLSSFLILPTTTTHTNLKKAQRRNKIPEKVARFETRLSNGPLYCISK